MVKASRSSRGTQGGERDAPKAPIKKEKNEMLGGVRPDPRPEKQTPRIDPRIQREIGKHLRAHYDDVINEPIPDKFLELLEELEKSVKRKE